MFPFLAPVRNSTVQCYFETSSDRIAHIEFFNDIPSRSSSARLSTNRRRERSGNSDGSGGSVQSRPSSQQKGRPHLSSTQPTRSRSAKSSPIPPAPSEIPPPPSRHRQKGLETSSAMLELLGGGPSSASDSFFQRIPNAPADTNFHRKGILESFTQESTTGNKAPIFSQVEDHDRVYERTRKRGGRTSSQYNQPMQPGPEWFEEGERMDMSGIDLPPDPSCPAERILNEMELTNEHIDLTPDSTSDWKEAKEDVLDVIPSDPGPDLGDNEDVEEGSWKEEEEIVTVNETTRNKLGDKADADTQSEGRDVEDLVGEESTTFAIGGGMSSLVIRGAQIINDDSVFVADVLIQDGIIRNVSTALEIPSDAIVIEASGRMLIPAGIDVHTHFSSPESTDDLTTGCKAALAGGTATVVEMVVPRSGESLVLAFNRVKQSLDTALCNVALSVVVRQWSEAVKKDMEKLVSDGVNSFIIEVDSDDALYQILDHCRTLGAHVRVLPENKSIVSCLEKKMLQLNITGPEGFLQSRPETLESERVSSICVLSQLTNCPVSILSVSSCESWTAVEKARQNGALAHCELASSAVATDASHYFNKCLKHAAGHLTDCPLRQDNGNRLLAALSSDPLAVCSSAHRAISSSARLSAKDFTQMPKGVAGVEERMCVVWEKAVRTARIDPMRFVAVTSTNAAKLFNIYPKKGRIAVGADADVVLWDGSSRRKLTSAEGQSGIDISIYEGMTVHSQAVMTIVGGRIAWKKEGGLKEAKGSFLPLQANSPYLFSVVQQRDKMTNIEKVEREASTNGIGGHKKSVGDDRNVMRKNHLESNIDFGSQDSRQSASRIRNPPGGKSTGIW